MKNTFPELDCQKTEVTLIFTYRGKVISGDDERHRLEKIAFQFNPIEFNVYHVEEQKKILETLKTQDLDITICGLKFPRHHPFCEIYEHKLQQIFATSSWNNGLRSHGFLETQWPSPNLKRFRTFNEPKVLNMKMLEPGFVIWTSSLLLAVAAFIFEWLITLKDYIVTKYILEAFYTTRRENTKFNQMISV